MGIIHTTVGKNNTFTYVGDTLIAENSEGLQMKFQYGMIRKIESGYTHFWEWTISITSFSDNVWEYRYQDIDSEVLITLLGWWNKQLAKETRK